MIRKRGIKPTIPLYLIRAKSLADFTCYVHIVSACKNPQQVIRLHWRGCCRVKAKFGLILYDISIMDWDCIPKYVKLSNLRWYVQDWLNYVILQEYVEKRLNISLFYYTSSIFSSIKDLNSNSTKIHTKSSIIYLF